MTRCRASSSRPASGTSGAVTLLHPSWWPPRWVAHILDAATSITAAVVALPRSSMIGSGDGAMTVSSSAVRSWRLSRNQRATHPPSTGRRSCDRRAGGKFPPVGPDPHRRAAWRARRKTRRPRRSKSMLNNGLSAHMVRLEDEVAHSTVEPPPATPVHRSWRCAQLAAATVVGIVVCGVGAATTRPAGVSAAGLPGRSAWSRAGPPCASRPVGR